MLVFTFVSDLVRSRGGVTLRRKTKKREIVRPQFHPVTKYKISLSRVDIKKIKI